MIKKPWLLGWTWRRVSVLAVIGLCGYGLGLPPQVFARERTTYITVVSPNGGEVLEQGKTHEAEWTSIGIPPEHDKVNIYLVNTRNGRRYALRKKTADNPSPNDGVEEVFIPCNTPGQQPGDPFVIELLSAQIPDSVPNKVKDRSDAPFRLDSSDCPGDDGTAKKPKVRRLALDAGHHRVFLQVVEGQPLPSSSFTLSNLDSQPVDVTLYIESTHDLIALLGPTSLHLEPGDAVEIPFTLIGSPYNRRRLGRIVMDAVAPDGSTWHQGVFVRGNPRSKSDKGQPKGQSLALELDPRRVILPVPPGQALPTGSFTIANRDSVLVHINLNVEGKLEHALMLLDEQSFSLEPGQLRQVRFALTEAPDRRRVAKILVDAVTDDGLGWQKSVRVSARNSFNSRSGKNPDGSGIAGIPGTMIWHGGGFSDGFIENIHCGILGGHGGSPHQKVTTNPLTGQSSTQAERQRMIQLRNFVCTPMAIAEIEVLIKKHQDTIDPELYQEAMDTTTGALLGQGQKIGAAAAAFFGTRKHFEALSKVMIDKSTFPDVTDHPVAERVNGNYDPGASNYAWIWPSGSARRVLMALDMVFDGGLDNSIVQEGLSPEVLGYLRGPTGKVPSAPRPPKGVDLIQLIVPDSVFFGPEGITPEQAQTLDAMTSLSQQAGETVFCLAKNGLPFEPDILCPGQLKTMRQIEDRDHHCQVIMKERQVPQMSPFIERYHVDERYQHDLPGLCQNLQQAHQAVRLWARSLRQGHTPKGFVNTWAAMYAHSLLVADRALSFQPNIDRNTLGQGPFGEKIRTLRDAAVPGLDSAGNCPMDFNLSVVDF